MGGLEHRLEKLEDAARPEPEAEVPWGLRPEVIRVAAEQDNDRFYRYARLGHEDFAYPGDAPPFEITPDGKVFTTRDGRLVTSYRQEHAEILYWQEVVWGGPGLIHDEAAEAFYMPDGELAVSRTEFDLRPLLGKPREEWIREEYGEKE